MSKGQIDVLTIGLVLFVIAFVGIIFITIMQAINTGVQSSGLVNASLTVSQDYTTNAASGWDQGIVVALAMSYILTLVFAFRINTNPGYFFIFLFVLIIVLGVISILPQVFDQATSTGAFSTARISMPMTTWVGQNIFLISIALTVFLIVALFAKISRVGGNQ